MGRGKNGFKELATPMEKMTLTPKHKRKITPQKAQEILAQHGTQVSVEQAKIILDFMEKFAILAVNQCLRR